MGAGKVYMHFRDGSSAWVTPQAAAQATKAGDGKVASRVRMMVVTESGNTINRDFNGARVPPLWQEQGTIMGEGDTPAPNTPPLQSAVNVLKRSTAQVLPSASAMAPMAIPGAGWAPFAMRTAASFGGGMLGDMGVKALQGEPQDPMASAVVGGFNAAVNAPFEGAAAAIPHLPEPLMKTALGNAQPGIEKYALSRGQEVSSRGLAARQAAIDASRQQADDLIASSTAKFPRNPFIRLVRSMEGKAKQGDILSTGQETALHQALGVTTQKMGPVVKTTKPGRIVGPNGQPLNPGTTTVTPRPDMTALEVDKIRRLADNEAKALRTAREANRDKTVGDLEGAYLQVSKLATRMLRTIPGVKDARLSASRDIQLQKAVFNATKRGHSAGLSAAIGGSVGLPAAYMSHDPMAAALGLPIATAHYLASTPQSMSRAALGLNNPRVAPFVRNAPRLAQAAAADILMRGARRDDGSGQ